MRKDPIEFRERFLRWKNGELVYENGLALPAYEDGKAPMLDRLEFDDGTKYLQWKKDFLDRYWSSEEQKRLGLDPKKEAIESMLHDNTAFNAGTLPGVVIKPPKDSKKVLSAAKEMLPIDKMRHNWYNNIDQIRDVFYPANNIDPYEYIRRMYNIYKASDKPRVSTTRVPEYTILHNPFDILGKEREMYDAILNTMYLNPDRPSFIDEMSHAFQFNTDVPRDNDFLPGDWKINGKSGYERPGHVEYTAHKIIQPILRNYLENQDTDYPIDDIIEVVTDIHDNPKAWGYPTREEVMNDKRSGRIAKGPRRGQLKDRYEDGLTPHKKSEVNTNEATYNPEEDLYTARYTVPEVTVTGRKSKVGTGYGKRLYMHPWKTVGDLIAEENAARPSVEEIAARAPYENDLHKPLSPVDPIGELIVGNAVLGPAFNYIGKGLSWAGNTITDEALIQAGKHGSKWARNKAVQRAMGNPVISTDVRAISPIVRTKVGEVGIDYGGDTNLFKNLFKEHNFELFLYLSLLTKNAKGIEKIMQEEMPMYSKSMVKGVVDKPMDLEIVNIYNNSVLPRLMAMRPGYKGGIMRPTVKSNVEAALNEGYTVYPDEVFKKAGKDLFGGFLYPDGHISIRYGNEDFALGHEMRHRLSGNFLPETKTETTLLESAYDDGFDELPKIYDTLKDVNMSPERVTTNFDARKQAIGKHHLLNTNWELQNKIIDKLSDERIFEAVEKSNGYGKKYIKYLRDNNRLTPEKARLFREAMKYVGAVVPFAPIGSAKVFNDVNR